MSVGKCIVVMIGYITIQYCKIHCNQRLYCNKYVCIGIGTNAVIIKKFTVSYTIYVRHLIGDEFRVCRNCGVSNLVDKSRMA